MLNCSFFTFCALQVKGRVPWYAVMPPEKSQCLTGTGWSRQKGVIYTSASQQGHQTIRGAISESSWCCGHTWGNFKVSRGTFLSRLLCRGGVCVAGLLILLGISSSSSWAFVIVTCSCEIGWANKNDFSRSLFTSARQKPPRKKPWVVPVKEMHTSVVTSGPGRLLRRGGAPRVDSLSLVYTRRLDADKTCAALPSHNGPRFKQHYPKWKLGLSRQTMHHGDRELWQTVSKPEHSCAWFASLDKTQGATQL